VEINLAADGATFKPSADKLAKWYDACLHSRACVVALRCLLLCLGAHGYSASCAPVDFVAVRLASLQARCSGQLSIHSGEWVAL
jgi:hypothetical protein